MHSETIMLALIVSLPVFGALLSAFDAIDDSPAWADETSVPGLTRNQAAEYLRLRSLTAPTPREAARLAFLDLQVQSDLDAMGIDEGSIPALAR